MTMGKDNELLPNLSHIFFVIFIGNCIHIDERGIRCPISPASLRAVLNPTEERTPL